MGRNKKIVSVDQKFAGLSKQEKVGILENFSGLYNFVLSQIPQFELRDSGPDKAEVIAAAHLRAQGFEVWHSKVNNGYRCIGAEFYWLSFRDKLTDMDMETIRRLSSILSPEEFEALAYVVKEKSGTPDLLLIRDNKISFVEVKYNSETVKASTIEFYVRYGDKWPLSILRVIGE